MFDPPTLFPGLALLFAVLAAVAARRAGGLRGAARTWALLALLFGAVAVWLRWA